MRAENRQIQCGATQDSRAAPTAGLHFHSHQRSRMIHDHHYSTARVCTRTWSLDPRLCCINQRWILLDWRLEEQNLRSNQGALPKRSWHCHKPLCTHRTRFMNPSAQMIFAGLSQRGSDGAEITGKVNSITISSLQDTERNTRAGKLRL
ncbi:hypothetical protein SEVIR_9G096466v4 [Setaria viridis]